MSESLLITLREGFEAALVVAIVLAAVRRSERPEMARWVWYGTGAALLLAVVIGWIIHVTVDDLTGASRSRVFAIICFGAAGLLTWMIFWMRKHARSLKGELEGKTLQALHESAFALGHGGVRGRRPRGPGDGAVPDLHHGQQLRQRRAASGRSSASRWPASWACSSTTAARPSR